MEPDYNQLWRNNDNQSPDAQFYAFYEDSLNQFIGANSGSNQSAADKNSEGQEDDVNKNKQNPLDAWYICTHRNGTFGLRNRYA